MNELELGYLIATKAFFDAAGLFCISYSLGNTLVLLYKNLFKKYDFVKEKLRNIEKAFESTSAFQVKKPGPKKAITIYPKLKEYKQTDYGLDLEYRLPVGMTFEKFAENLNVIESAIEGQCITWSEGRNVYIRAMMHELQRKYHFDKARVLCHLQDCKLGISIGETPLGYLVFDIAEKAMNIIVAGYAGAGKSVTLRQIVTSLQLAYTPQQVRLLLVDLKGGIELGLFEQSPFVDGLAIEHEEVLEEMLRLTKEMNYRYSVLRQENKTHISQLEGEPFPYILVVIDEFAEITPSCLKGEEKKIAQEIENEIGRLLRMGRAAGIHFIFCTQRPDSEIVDGQIKANIQTKICHRVRDSVNSRVVIGNNKAYTLEPYPGRGIFQGPIRIGEEEMVMDMKFQSPYLSPEQARAMLVERYREFNSGNIVDISEKLKNKGVIL